jgi:penicillin V acylase-like amidase (Ntn superfamily)
MKKLFALFVLIITKVSLVSACTTFLINKNGQLVFGRNYDWVTDAGIVCTNLKGLAKTSIKTRDGETISWVSQYGSITFNQYGKEFPTGGMNEKGLVVELMWLDETKYPAADKRPAVDVLQWVQYQLDNCATIEDVIATDKKLRIASVGNTPLHYLVADANGNASTIEFLNGKLVAHTGNALVQPVLTNNIYDESVKALRSATTYNNNSLERFNQACNMIKQFKSDNNSQPATDYAFNILAEVAQGDYTKWSIVYDITNKTISFKTNRFKQVKAVAFSAFDFNCNASAKTFEMNQAAHGSINKLFVDFNNDINKKIIEKAAMESRSQIDISQKAIEAQWKYIDGIKCK